jgi:hypothetical protein
MKLTAGLFLIGALLFSAVSDDVIERFILYPFFVALEHDKAQKEMGRCIDPIKTEIFHLEIVCSNWAAFGSVGCVCYDDGSRYEYPQYI